MREVLNAILYLLRTSCPWDLLPKELPAKSTVFGYFRRWWEDGTWPVLHAKLVMAARELKLTPFRLTLLTGASLIAPVATPTV